MSLLEKSVPLSYLSNKEKERFFLSEDDDDDFNFKYVSAGQYENVGKDARRQRLMIEEEHAWTSFIKRQASKRIPNARIFLRDDVEVDRELKRLEEDALPERNKTVYKHSFLDSIVGNRLEERGFAKESRSKVSSTKDTDMDSTDILLTIPEEEKILSAYRKSLRSKQKRRSTAKRSSSDHVLRKRNYSESVHRTVNDSEYSSSPEFSPDRVSEKEECCIYARPDPIAAHKIMATQKKISDVLDEISFLLGRIPLPDGERDAYRRQQRLMEFSVRFSRNYLYELSRQLVEIQRHVRAVSPSVRPKPSRRNVSLHMRTIEQKLVSSHQMLLQALNAYRKHIPSSILKGHPGKLKEILQLVIDLKEICTKVHITNDYYGAGDADVEPLGNDIQGRCSAILSKVRTGSDNELQMESHTTRSTLAAALPPSSRTKRRSNYKYLSNRLSMYSMESHAPKSHRSKRSSGCCQNERRYSANAGSRILSDNHPPTPEQPHPSPATQISFKAAIRNGTAKIKVPPREDDIRTVMDAMPADSDIESSIGLASTGKSNDALPIERKIKVERKASVGVKSLPGKKYPRDARKFHSAATGDRDTAKKVTTISQEQLSKLVPVIADLMSFIQNKHDDFEIKPVSSASMETLMGLLHKYHSPESPNIDVSSNGERRIAFRHSQRSKIDQKHSKSNNRLSRSTKDCKSGSKNMQLLCLASEEKTDGIPKYNDASCQANCEDSRVTSNFRMDTSITEDRKSTVTSESQTRLVIPATVEAHILDYQKQYQESSSASPMYSSNTQNKPWDVVAWIADKLVDELIVNVSKELEMGDVIKKLFDLEFQEF